MAKSNSTKRDEQRELTRRGLIKWTLAAGAALGVGRGRILETLEKVGGSNLAYAAATGLPGKVIIVQAGNGGLANWNLLWPQPVIHTNPNNNQSFHMIGQTTMYAGTDKPLVYAADTPWQTLNAKKQMTVFMAGANQTHVGNATLDVGANSMVSVLTAIQTASSSVVPVVGVGDIGYDTGAAGAPPIAGVQDPGGIVGLFNSAASRAGGLLENPADASLYKAHYTALASLNRAANRGTTQAAYQTGVTAAGFLGTNLAAVLSITQDDRNRYGIDGGMPSSIVELAEGFIIAVKAFQLGLTNAVLLPGLRDDPHGRFDGGDAGLYASNLKKVHEGLMNDLTATTGENGVLADETVLVVHGDTPKDPLVRGGWGDGTAGNTNWIYVYGAGYLKTGWHGTYDANGNVMGWDPATGNPIAYDQNQTMRAAAAAIAYAVARGDKRRVQDFSNMNIDGVTNILLT